MPRKPTTRIQDADRRYRELRVQGAVNHSEAARKGWETRRARAQAKMTQNVQDAIQDMLDQNRLTHAVETGMGLPIGYINKDDLLENRAWLPRIETATDVGLNLSEALAYAVPDGPGGAMKASAPSSQVKPETVSHPLHYGGDTTYEAIKVIEAWRLDFCLGNAVKYICRAGRKGDVLDDLQKAAWYLGREISRIEERRIAKG